jgi:hypothetical protein
MEQQVNYQSDKSLTQFLRIHLGTRILEIPYVISGGE